ncbi:MAG: T9SS C-terminal target domain-containing protein [Calditrichaeota bacterium]|nr:MAG: T9SS C-terminal target domain-containing protein [Calditrichota bacterium]MBL1208143.1 T9SS C-terminal target domain-containing protein [Calditrichota bacterium]NOG47981.1 T9SS type A sorting domain-containing protein [Calditrichota bacterium]
MKYGLYFLFLYGTLFGSSFNLSGDITSNTIITQDTVFVTGNVNVLSEVTLEIKSPSIVIFMKRYKLNVMGRLLALGQPDNRITFTAHDPDIAWYGIRFKGPSNLDSSKITFSIIEYCIARENQAANADSGGAIYINNYSKLLISNCIIKNNEAGYGGAIYCYNSNVKILNNVIIENESYVEGGAIYSINSSPYIEGNTIKNNFAGPAWGGGLFLKGGQPVIKTNLISHNTGDFGGGGILCWESNAEIIENTIVANSAPGGEGGAIRCYMSNTNIYRNKIFHNSAQNGGGLYFYSCDLFSLNNNLIYENNAEENGGGVLLIRSNGSINNNTIYDNSASNGSGISLSHSNPRVENSIIADGFTSSTPSLIHLQNNEADPYFFYNNIQGSLASFTGDGSGSNYLTTRFKNNIDFNPNFGDSLFHLSDSSLLIDAGNPKFSFDAEPDYNGRRINIGGYGNTNESAVSNPELVFSLSMINSDSLSLEYGDTVDVWIYNLGITRLNIDSLYLSSNDGFMLIFDDDGFIISGDSIKASIIFFPNDAGYYFTELIILSNDQDEEKVNIKMSGSYYLESPFLKIIKDIPDDQGGWVKVQFARSAFDTDSLIFPKTSSTEFYTIEINGGSGWTADATTAAYGKSLYSVLVPTTKDSTSESDGLIYFRVIAGMEEGNYVSQIDSGYSVDNLKPSVPNGLFASIIAESKVKLKWLPNSETDFKFYTIYRKVNSQFESIHQTIDTVFTDLTVQVEQSYSYAIASTDHSGNESSLSEAVEIVVTSLNEESVIPSKYYLAQNYPNPFNPETTIMYGLKNGGYVEIVIYDVLGNKIKDLVSGYKTAGHHQITWAGENDLNEKVSSGVFFYQIITNDFKQHKKMLLLK